MSQPKLRSNGSYTISPRSRYQWWKTLLIAFILLSLIMSI